MFRKFVPPFDPDAEASQPPMVYIREELTWEFKRVVRDLDQEKPLDEQELNELGADGWELVTSVTYGSSVTFYFRRPKK